MAHGVSLCQADPHVPVLEAAEGGVERSCLLKAGTADEGSRGPDDIPEEKEMGYLLSAIPNAGTFGTARSSQPKGATIFIYGVYLAMAECYLRMLVQKGHPLFQGVVKESIIGVQKDYVIAFCELYAPVPDGG